MVTKSGTLVFTHTRLSSMPDGNDGRDKPSIVDLVNDAVIADPDAPGIPTFEFFATGWAWVLLQIIHLPSVADDQDKDGQDIIL